MKTIVLGVAGSIAAYKAADLASQFTQSGHRVFVVMTEHAQEFIGELTLKVLSRNPVTTHLFNEKQSWHPGHIQLADDADLLLIAPATANVIAKLANGIADDALTSIALATRAKILIAPAMNGKMWEHPATQETVSKLTKFGAKFVGPSVGLLACGYEGLGRLAEVDEILSASERLLEVAPASPNDTQ